MKTHFHSRVGATLLLLFLLSLPAAAQISDVYVLPAMGYTAGGGGTFWVNDFHVMNPQGYPLKVTLIYLPTASGDSLSFTLTLAANETQWSENILAEFDLAGVTGSLVVFVDPDDNPAVDLEQNPAGLGVVVQSRSFNEQPGGTLGQGVPGVMTGLADYELDFISAIATGVSNWGAVGVEGFRTNVGAANLSRFSATLWVSVISDAGSEVARHPFILNPGTHWQERLPTTIDHGSLEYWVQFPNDVTPDFDDLIIPYASIIDNRTGDPTYLNPTLLAVPSVLWGKQGAAASVRTPARVSAETARRLAAGSTYLGEARRDATAAAKSRLVGPRRSE